MNGSVRYMAPELLIIPDESDDDDNLITGTMKKTDVYAFSMVGVEVSLFQMTHMPAFQGHYHRFCLDNSLTARYITIIGSRSEFQRVYDQEEKNMNCPDYMQRYGTFLSLAGFLLLQKDPRCQWSYSNCPM